MEILVGADPELFVMKEGKFLSGHDMIPGTKTNPHPVECGAVQVDGMALEFNIDPTANSQVFAHNINKVMSTLRDMVPSEFDLAIHPAAEFDAEYMKGLPEKALELGCSPDYNAWTGEENPLPDGSSTMRTASGHVHIGWTEDEDPNDPIHFASCRAVVKQLDYYLGATFIIRDRDNRRRKMYGRAGAFRPKSYGVEYRVLSNFWIREERFMTGVHDLTVQALLDMRNGRVAEETMGDKVVDCINNSDVDMAFDITNQIGIAL